MTKFFLVIIGAAIFTAALVFAAELPQTLPHQSQQGYLGFGAPSRLIERRSFYVEGVKYLSLLSQPQTASPDWQPAAPLPISLSKAEEVARGQLRRFVKQDSTWQVSDFQISRFGAGVGWYYSVTLKPAIRLDKDTDSFTVLLNLSGQPGPIARTATP